MNNPLNVSVSRFIFTTLPHMKLKSLSLLQSMVFVTFGIILLFLSTTSFALSNSIVAVDNAGTVGQYTSLMLDAQGNPIISYYDVSEAKLKVAHCFDKNCAQFNAILTPDAANNVGQYTSMTVDNHGNPVVSYYDQANSALKILHCGNASCSTGNTLATADSVGTVGLYTAITVNSNGWPVVSYYDATKGVLKVLRCGNAACTAGNSIVTPDLASSNGVQSSIKLNAMGNPVVAYFDFTHSSLKVLRCGNAQCTAGNTITTADASSNVGRYPSLLFDNSGNPVVSYLDLTNGKLKILHCGNASCSTGNSIASVGSGGIVGYFSSLALNASGNPVVSYYDLTHGKLNILQCGNSTCTSGNTLTVPDSSGSVGQYTSLKLDANGNPVVSYYDASNGDLKILHCVSQTCSLNSVVVADGAASVGQYTSLKLDTNGNPVVSYWDETNGDLKLLHCGNALCSTNNTITTPDTTGNTGWDTSLVLDASGKPVIGFYDFTAKIMKILHCNNTNCSGANTITKPDILSFRGASIALDSAGHPVAAASGQSDQGLRVVHCGDATCSSNNTITSPDFPVFPAQADVRGVSLVLDGNGNPVVSFYRADTNQLKLLHCADPACAGPGNSIAVLDPGAQAGDHRSTSLVLDASSNPVIAYQDSTSNSVKILHCGNVNCTAGNSIVSAATPNLGAEPSIKLDAAGYPVVSFSANGGLAVLHCGNATCTAGNTIVIGDSSASGWDSSLALDASGNPVVSYYNANDKNLKVLHCGTPSCQ